MEDRKISKKIENNTEPNLVGIIRIKGDVKVKPGIKKALDVLRLRNKYVCVILNSSNKNLLGILDKIKYSASYGKIEKDTFIKLLNSRAKPIIIPNSKIKKEFKIDPEKIYEDLLLGKKLSDYGIKPYFRLHPPRGGINSKLNYPKGVLGNNKKDINKLIERML